MAKPIEGEKVFGAVNGVQIGEDSNRPYKLIFTDKRVLSSWTMIPGGAVDPSFELTEELLKHATSEVTSEKVKEVILKKNSLTAKAGTFHSAWVRFPEENFEIVKTFVSSTPFASKLKMG